MGAGFRGPFLLRLGAWTVSHRKSCASECHLGSRSEGPKRVTREGDVTELVIATGIWLPDLLRSLMKCI